MQPFPQHTMSIATHAARFRRQLAFEFPTVLLPPPPAPPLLERPTVDALAAAAAENLLVQEFIADRVLTWSNERVRNNPPCYLVYEHGEVVGNVSDLPIMMRHAQKRSGLGRMLGIRALEVDDEVLPYNIGLRRGPTHPGRFRYEQRMALKGLLPRHDRCAVRVAMRRNRRDFVDWADTRPGFATRLSEATGLSLIAFWRAVRGRNTPKTPAAVHPDVGGINHQLAGLLDEVPSRRAQERAAPPPSTGK